MRMRTKTFFFFLGSVKRKILLVQLVLSVIETVVVLKMKLFGPIFSFFFLLVFGMSENYFVIPNKLSFSVENVGKLFCFLFRKIGNFTGFF